MVESLPSARGVFATLVVLVILVAVWLLGSEGPRGEAASRLAPDGGDAITAGLVGDGGGESEEPSEEVTRESVPAQPVAVELEGVATGREAESPEGEVIPPQRHGPPGQVLTESQVRERLRAVCPTKSGPAFVRGRAETFSSGIREISIESLPEEQAAVARSIMEVWSSSIDPLANEAAVQLESALEDWYFTSPQYGLRPIEAGAFRRRAVHSSAYTRVVQIEIGGWFADLSFYSEDYPYLESSLEAFIAMKERRDIEVREAIGFK